MESPTEGDGTAGDIPVEEPNDWFSNITVPAGKTLNLTGGQMNVDQAEDGASGLNIQGTFNIRSGAQLFYMSSSLEISSGGKMAIGVEGSLMGTENSVTLFKKLDLYTSLKFILISSVIYI